jgi:AraC-like DNA-binding protein
VLAKLAELLFVDAERRHLDSLPEDASGWLAGLRDPHVAAALALLHGSPRRDWTVDQLARAVGQSRSVFARRFTHVVHDTPMHYLTRWRMQLAAHLMERQGMSLAQVAADVGYDSEAAFNRAFKKCLGSPPGEWRRSHRPAAPP